MQRRIMATVLTLMMVLALLPATPVMAATQALTLGGSGSQKSGAVFVDIDAVNSFHEFTIEVPSSGELTIAIKARNNVAPRSVFVTLIKPSKSPDSAMPGASWSVAPAARTQTVAVTSGTYTLEVSQSGAEAGECLIAVEFYAKHRLTVTSADPVAGIASANAPSISESDTLTITAVPNSGYVFDRWELTSKQTVRQHDGTDFVDVVIGDAEITNTKAAVTSIKLRADGSGSAYGDVSVVAHFIRSSGITLEQPQSNTGSISASKLNASPGETITLTSSARTGYVFSRWVVKSGNVSLSDASSSTTTFIMPSNPVVITAEFIGVKNITQGTVAGGSVSISKNKAYTGDTVNIWAYPNSNMEFVSWQVSGAVGLLNVNSTSTSFTVGEQDCVVTANFKQKDPANSEYDISVVRNSSTWGYVSTNKSQAKQGETVTLTATSYSAGRFVNWEVQSGGVTLTDSLSNITTFTMPASDVSIRAVFAASDGSTGNNIVLTPNDTSYGITLASVTQAASGTQVAILAAPSIGYSFTRWEVQSGGVTIANSTSANTTFTMGSLNVNIRAVFTKTGTVTGGTTVQGGSTSWGDYLNVLNMISSITSSANAAERLSRLAGSLVVSGNNGAAQPAVIVQDMTTSSYYMNGYSIQLSNYGLTTSGMSTYYNKAGEFTQGSAKVAVFLHKNLTTTEIKVVDANIAAGILVHAEMQPGSGSPLGSSSWATAAIQAAVQAGVVPSEILSNYSAAITRAEYCKLAVYTMMAKYGYGNDINGFITRTGVNINSDPFSDTSDTYIKIAYSLGIINGTKAPTYTEKGTFLPFASITRQEAAVMAANLGKVLSYTPGNAPIVFNDATNIASWAKSGVDYATAARIMVGTSASPPQFSPLSTYTREQGIVTLMNFYGQLPLTMPVTFSLR